MSTDYRTEKEITFAELFDGRLESYGVKEKVVEGKTAADFRSLVDGHSYVWVYGDEVVSVITRYGLSNNPYKIISAIAEAFETDIFSERQPQYWGYETEEEWEKAWHKIHEEDQAKFYVKIIKYVTGQPNDIKPGTVGMTKANIAKELIAENPNLASPLCMEKLMEAIDRIYMDNHATVITLSDQDIAMAQMMATHEDDLSRA